jgi:hypothetical protein
MGSGLVSKRPSGPSGGRTVCTPPAPPPSWSPPERFRYTENRCSFEAIVAQPGKFCKPYHGTTIGCMALNCDHNMLGYGWGKGFVHK